MLRSGGPREFSVYHSAFRLISICPGSSNVARSNGSASEQQDPFVVPSTPPPAQRTRSDVYSGVFGCRARLFPPEYDVPMFSAGEGALQ